MGRPRLHRKDLPKRLYVIDGIYYYFPKGAKPINLGTDEDAALRQYRKHVPLRARLKTLGDIMDRYLVEVIPTKAPRTQLDNQRELKNLRQAFADFLPDELMAQDIYKYLDGRNAPVRANREIALLSHLFKKAIRWGAATQNPCVRGEIEKNREAPRTRYVEDTELEFFKKHASPMIRAYCDFKYLTGMRKGDILMLTRANLQEDGIRYVQRKTRKRHPRTGEMVARERVVLWSPELRQVVNCVQALRQGRRMRVNGKRVPLPDSIYLFATKNGSPYYDERKAKADGFDAIWKRYMAKAKLAATAEGWELQHFTEHDIRAKAGSDAADAGQLGHKLLGNSEKQFRTAYDRGVERVVPLNKRRA